MSESHRCVRLACEFCDRDDCDWMTHDELEDCLWIGGWTAIQQFQDLEFSQEIYEDLDEAPEGWSVLDWYTHLGICPDCQNEM